MEDFLNKYGGFFIAFGIAAGTVLLTNQNKQETLEGVYNACVQTAINTGKDSPKMRNLCGCAANKTVEKMGTLAFTPVIGSFYRFTKEQNVRNYGNSYQLCSGLPQIY